MRKTFLRNFRLSPHPFTLIRAFPESANLPLVRQRTAQDRGPNRITETVIFKSLTGFLPAIGTCGRLQLSLEDS